MVKITVDLLERSKQCVNACGDRELTLRGNHIETLENLGITKNQYDTIDLSDNNLLRITKFPPLPRLKTLIICNNNISRITKDALTDLELQSLVLTRNRFKDFCDLHEIGKVKTLERVCLLENDVTMKPKYREYVIYMLRETKLKMLDFQKVTPEEKKKAFLAFTTNPELLFEIAPVREEEKEPLTETQKVMLAALIQSATNEEDLDLYSQMFDGTVTLDDELIQKRYAEVNENLHGVSV